MRPTEIVCLTENEHPTRKALPLKTVPSRKCTYEEKNVAKQKMCLCRENARQTKTPASSTPLTISSASPVVASSPSIASSRAFFIGRFAALPVEFEQGADLHPRRAVPTGHSHSDAGVNPAYHRPSSGVQRHRLIPRRRLLPYS
ncbi:hypothetical protein KSP40_PGU007037 [Platanthera guangdongensis]|uniref:Uncharacterized protein n=1 Tax=Platanthera guangdongensis TaxID=2320717 RepID=A0ABR2LCQ5_9ASPA